MPGHASLRWQAGAVVGGRFRLRAPLGAGAMGEVWRAQHMTLGTDVALKLVDTAGRADAAETLARFGLEARAAAQLKSPHVVSILDHGVDGSVAFMAMELLDGESLEHRLARRGRLTPSETAHVLREMARGVDRAHAAGIVHRDLKPPNVFLARVDQTEVVKVLDFGIAKVLGAAADAHLVTQAGYVLGTPAYMSPEQVLGRAVDPRADLWSMAVIAFECVTGARPFEGETLGQLFMAVCSGPMPIPSQVAAAQAARRGDPGGMVPPGFDAWFARAADRDPAGRFTSAGAMAEALGALLAPGGVGESAVPTVAMSKPRAAPGASAGGTGSREAWSAARVEPPRRAPPVAIIAGFLVAPLLAVGAFGALRAFAAFGARPTPAPTTVEATPPSRPAPVPAAPDAGAPPAVSSAPVSAATVSAASATPSAAASAAPAPGPAHRGGSNRRSGTPSAPIDLGI